jgi:hypothetical protein
MLVSENTALQTVNVFVHGSYCLAISRWKRKIMYRLTLP